MRYSWQPILFGIFVILVLIKMKSERQQDYFYKFVILLFKLDCS